MNSALLKSPVKHRGRKTEMIELNLCDRMNCEQTNDETLQLTGKLSDWTKKSQMVPLTAIFKARRL